MEANNPTYDGAMDSGYEQINLFASPRRNDCQYAPNLPTVGDTPPGYPASDALRTLAAAASRLDSGLPRPLPPVPAPIDVAPVAQVADVAYMIPVNEVRLSSGDYTTDDEYTNAAQYGDSTDFDDDSEDDDDVFNSMPIFTGHSLLYGVYEPEQ